MEALVEGVITTYLGEGKLLRFVVPLGAGGGGGGGKSGLTWFDGCLSMQVIDASRVATSQPARCPGTYWL